MKMTKLLKWVGWIVIVFGLIAGIFGSKVPVLKQSSLKTFGTYLDSEFSWTLFFTYIIGAALTGLIFIALASILERTEQNNDYLYELTRRTPIQREEHKPLGTSRAELGKIGDYKMKAMD